MQHLNEEQLVLHRYHDDGVEAVAAEQHLNDCADCRAQYDTLCRVLALVDDLPVPQRGEASVVLAQRHRAGAEQWAEQRLGLRVGGGELRAELHRRRPA